MADISDSLDDLSLYYKEIISDNTLDAVFGSRFVKGSKVSNYPKFKLFLNRFANNLIKIIFFLNIMILQMHLKFTKKQLY